MNKNTAKRRKKAKSYKSVMKPNPSKRVQNYYNDNTPLNTINIKALNGAL